MNFIGSNWDFDSTSADEDTKILILSGNTFSNFIGEIMMLGVIVWAVGAIVSNIILVLLKMCEYEFF